MKAPRWIAEVSSNHGRDPERCLAFIDKAAQLGLQGVKFQQFRIEQLFAPEALRRSPELAARRAWELPESFNAELSAAARARGLEFASTPFYLDAVGVLEPWVDFFKIASYQVLWHELLREVAASGKPLVLATGMATLDEVRAALDVVGQAGCTELVLLHCVSLYPTPPEHANLAAIETLRQAFGVPVGWSDHSVDARVVLRAVRHFGACLVEFHLDLDGQGAEFDAGHCWLPADVRALLKAFHSGAETSFAGADGDGIKVPSPHEQHERAWRTDPSDGLRPLLAERASLWGESA